MRRCTRCRSTKELTEFYANKRGRDGLTAACKECIREAAKQYRTERPERVRETNRTQRAKNADRLREANRQWRLANPDKVAASKARARERDPLAAAERTRRWREANPERERENTRRWSRENAEYKRERARAYGAQLPEGERARRLREWRRANPEAHRVIAHRRRAAKRSLDFGDVTPEAMAAIFAAFDGQCAYCLNESATHVDHYVPLKLGGLHALDNLVPACTRCNTSKGAKAPEEWLY